jgi:hypothetical protein
MADKKISALTAATTPLAGTEVLPIVQSGSTVKVANNDLRPKQIQSNATSGVLQVAGPASAATRVMTTPDANFTAARTDAAQSFTGDQTISTGNVVFGTVGKGMTGGTVVTGVGSTSIPTATATTIFALPTTTYVCSLQVFCNLIDVANSNSYVVIVYDRTNARIAVNGNDVTLLISISGRNVQVTQTFGSTQTIEWGYILSKYA